jgi:hypothetical protein
MVENIKQTKDAQGPDDAKMNEVCHFFVNNYDSMFKYLGIGYETSILFIDIIKQFFLLVVFLSSNNYLHRISYTNII